MSSAAEPVAPTRPASVVPVPLGDVATHLSIGPLDPAVASVRVTGVSQSSRSVARGDLFVALPGARTHGAVHGQAAADAGAVAFLTDEAGAALLAGTGLACLTVPSPREVIGSVASLVYAHPSRDLVLIGVTGTQGKTTTTQLINAGAAGAGRRTAVIGTMGSWIDGLPVPSALTTPEAPDLHALFAVMRERGVEVCAMEVSSHAIVMGRVDAVVFDLAVFTNFGRDHLDFHPSVQEYFAAKAELFTPARARRALVNADDGEVAKLTEDPQIPTRTFSTRERGGDWWCDEVETTATGSTFTAHGPSGAVVSCGIGLVGDFNVANALTAVASLAETGTDAVLAAQAIAHVPTVPGRMEAVDAGQPFSVIVDYAHKPDAVAAALQALRPVTSGSLTIVIGSGGDRDQGKRPLMGEIAARLADVVIVTDDNPRSEDPARIRAEVVAGSRGGPADVLEIGDRRTAIERALREARPGDTVLIAGKGHETGQHIGDDVLPFDDRDVARAILESLRGVAP
ncbi:MAG: UDP-N-acetylmuramoyl-L-alanyl-D-glutamate--2,6-diaminopimelate ligase [Nocardioidaceae bacterium]